MLALPDTRFKQLFQASAGLQDPVGKNNSQTLIVAFHDTRVSSWSQGKLFAHVRLLQVSNIVVKNGQLQDWWMFDVDFAALAGNRSHLGPGLGQCHYPLSLPLMMNTGKVLHQPHKQLTQLGEAEERQGLLRCCGKEWYTHIMHPFGENLWRNLMTALKVFRVKKQR